MSKNKCTHKYFWGIYKIINFSKNFCEKAGSEFKCEKCNKKCVLKWKGCKKMKKSWIKKYITYFLWLLPAIVLIYLSVTQIISYLLAILLIIIFHFLAMFYVINSDKLIVEEK